MTRTSMRNPFHHIGAKTEEGLDTLRDGGTCQVVLRGVGTFLAL